MARKRLSHSVRHRRQKKKLYVKQNRKCATINCQITGIHSLTVDHIIPKAKGGSDGLVNKQLLCYRCHKIKDNINITKKGLKAAEREIYRNILQQEKGIIFSEWKGFNSYFEMEMVIKCKEVDFWGQ